MPLLNLSTMKRPHSETEEPQSESCPSSSQNTSRRFGVKRLPKQHLLLSNSALPGCIVRQGFDCAILTGLKGSDGLEQCLSIHPNGLAVVQLAPTHPAVGTGDSTVTQVRFGEGQYDVLASKKVVGKKKKGAMQIYPNSLLCTIHTQGGKEYQVCAGVSGELMEVNTAVLDEPGIISSNPLGRGWFIIVRLKPRDQRRLLDAMGPATP
ncbi:unnamed protein product [Choristocarpus tenellus]